MREFCFYTLKKLGRDSCCAGERGKQKGSKKTKEMKREMTRGVILYLVYYYESL